LNPSVLPEFSYQIQRFIYLDSHSSTNEFAMKSISNNDPKQHSCVYTYNQNKGRGQIGRKWYSGTDKNITCSFRFYLENFKVKDQFMINMAFSLSIVDFIETYTEQEVKIKWPNDIYVGNNKIAGILIQNMVRTSLISSSILGVGININEDDFPGDLPNPISLYEQTDNKYNLLELQLHLASCVEHRMASLSQDLRTEYLSKIFRIDELAVYSIDEEDMDGIIRGVAEDGKLELEVRGQRKLFAFRELEFVI